MKRNLRIECFIKMIDKNKDLRAKHTIGMGSSRRAFALGDLVIKIPTNESGIWQTITEINVWENSTPSERAILLEPIYYGKVELEDATVPYIVMERVRVAEDYRDLCRAIWHDGVFEAQKQLRFKIHRHANRAIDALCERWGLKEADFFNNEGNYGLTKNNELKFCDYGFCGFDEEDYSNTLGMGEYAVCL